MKEILERFEEIAADPGAYAVRWKTDTGRPVVGTFCSYAPEEIIYAAGALPFRMIGSGAEGGSDAYLQSYCCSVVKNTLDDALSGSLDFLDGVVFPHTCDSVQRLSDIFRLNLTGFFHTDVIMPANLGTKSAEAYTVSVLERMVRDLEKKVGTRIAKDDLSGAARVFNRIRRGLKRISRAAAENRIHIRSRNLHTISKAVMSMDPGEAAELLEQLCTFIQEEPVQDSGRLIRIGLTGSVCTAPSVYNTIEQAGGFVVFDDFCTMDRYFDFTVDESAEPLTGIARRYLEKAVCPCKHAGLYSRGERISRRACELDAMGVIFLLLKFCDPHAFDYPYIRDMLEKRGIKSMVFELDDEQSVHAQFKTRCGAFMEMLQDMDRQQPDV
ncbi:MAG: 2-hydroxyacyl-CoA dehydratase family protein [Desulfobacteraceae bacterium]